MNAIATRACSPLNLTELYVNGRKVGDDVLAPAHCQIKKRFHYKVRDLSGLIPVPH